MHPNTKDLTGKRFGRLVVRELTGRVRSGSGKVLAWLCDCDCGGSKVVLGRYLNDGGTQSCGCLAKESAQKNVKAAIKAAQSFNTKLPPGRPGRNQLLKSYKEGAAKRNLEWSLFDKNFDMLTKSNCYYCGKPPLRMSRRRKSDDRFYLFNGIDRVDNSKGYVVDNCVSCCKECNFTKNNVTMQIAHRMIDFNNSGSEC